MRTNVLYNICMGGCKVLTKKQRIVLNAINEYVKKERISPTVRELCDILGLRSTSTIQGYINRLEEYGYIAKKKDSPRSLKILKMY